MSVCIDLELVVENVSANEVVIVRLSGEASYAISPSGISLSPQGDPGSPQGFTLPLTSLMLNTDTATLCVGATCSFTMVLGVMVDDSATTLDGSVTLATGTSVALSQLGNRISEKVTKSSSFSITIRP